MDCCTVAAGADAVASSSLSEDLLPPWTAEHLLFYHCYLTQTLPLRILGNDWLLLTSTGTRSLIRLGRGREVR